LYESENWFPPAEKCTSRVFEDRALGSIFKPEREKKERMQEENA
jgi:hypothetical protein